MQEPKEVHFEVVNQDSDRPQQSDPALGQAFIRFNSRDLKVPWLLRHPRVLLALVVPAVILFLVLLFTLSLPIIVGASILGALGMAARLVLAGKRSSRRHSGVSDGPSVHPFLKR